MIGWARAAAVAAIVLGLGLSSSSAEYRFWATATRGQLMTEVLDGRLVERPLEVSYPARLRKAFLTPAAGEESRFYLTRLILPFLGLVVLILSLPERRQVKS